MITRFFFLIIILQGILNQGMATHYPYGKKSTLFVLYNDSIVSLNQNLNLKSERIESMPPLLIRYGIMLDTVVETVSNYPLYSFVDDWIGVDYQYGGNDKSGVDCSSFCLILFREIYGIKLPRTSAEQYSSTIPISDDDLCEGDLLFFKTGEHPVSHVGVYLGNGKFVHASTQKGITIDNLSGNYYKKTYFGAGRMIQF